MLNKSFSVVAMLFLAVFVCGRAHAQATVTGGQGSYIYVDGSSGSDSNPGTSAKPLKTIQAGVDAALANNAAGVATVVSIKAGVYREAVTMGGTQTSAPITIEAASAGTVYIDGADVLTKSYQSSGSVYAYPWTDTVKGCPLPANWYTGMPPVVLANEMVFVNGAPLTQVMLKSQLTPGTFYVNDSYNEVDLDPPSGTDMSTAKVEASSRRTTLTLNGVSNVVLQGLVLQHAASCMNVDGANINSGSNVLIDDVQANWNNWGGLGVNGSDHVTVENSTASYNGGVGFAGFEDTNSLFANNESDYNNWRGEMVGLYDFGQGGTKLMHVHTLKVTGQKSYNNGAQGLWFDTDNTNITISGAKLAGNTVDNLQLELNQGPITVENSSFCGGGVGVNLLETAGATLTGNHFYGNGGPIAAQNGQLFLSGKAGGRRVTNFETGASANEFTTNLTLKQNTFTAVGPGQFVFNTYLSGDDWSRFINSLNSSDNEWFDAANVKAFGLAGGKKTDFAGWKSVSGDTTSSWALSGAAQSGCGVPAPAYQDFNLLAHNAAAYVSEYMMSAQGTLTIPLQVTSFGFGAVTLSAPGLPTGVSAAFSPVKLVSGDSALTLTAYSSAKAQTVPLTVFATSGSRVHTITLEVSIRPGKEEPPVVSAPATPKISANPTTVSVTAPGSAGTTALSVSGFAGSAFQFSCSGLPSGAKCVFGALKGSGSAGTLSLRITTAAPTTASLATPAGSGRSQVMLALAIPGVIAILGLFTTRRRFAQWNSRVALLLILSTGIFLSGCGVSPGSGNHFIAASSGGGSDGGSGSGSAGSGSGSSGSSGTSTGGSAGSSSGSGSGSSGSSGSGSSGTSSGGSSSGSSSGSGSSGSGTSGSGSSGSSSGSGSGSSGSGTGTGSGSSGSGSGSGSGASGSGTGTSGTSGSGSSGSSSGGSSASSTPGTPTGTSTIKVTAVSGKQVAAVSLTLRVE